MMWFLLIIFLMTGQETVLNHFILARECQEERERIAEDMNEAYAPKDRDFEIVCRYQTVTNPRSRA